MNDLPSKFEGDSVNEAEFENQVLCSVRPTLVWFYAPGSRYCGLFRTVLAEVAAARADRMKIVTVDVTKSRVLTAWLEVEFVPTLLLFVGGDVRSRMVGMTRAADILAELDRVLDQAPSVVTEAVCNRFLISRI